MTDLLIRRIIRRTDPPTVRTDCSFFMILHRKQTCLIDSFVPPTTDHVLKVTHVVTGDQRHGMVTVLCSFRQTSKSVMAAPCTETGRARTNKTHGGCIVSQVHDRSTRDPHRLERDGGCLSFSCKSALIPARNGPGPGPGVMLSGNGDAPSCNTGTMTLPLCASIGGHQNPPTDKQS